MAASIARRFSGLCISLSRHRCISLSIAAGSQKFFASGRRPMTSCREKWIHPPTILSSYRIPDTRLLPPPNSCMPRSIPSSARVHHGYPTAHGVSSKASGLFPVCQCEWPAHQVRRAGAACGRPQIRNFPSDRISSR
eukprot:5507362-Prymnesium_polylepis.1